MAEDGDFEEPSVRWSIGGSVAALALLGCLVFLWIVFDISTAEETAERGLAAVTFVVGGMMKSRSGIT